MYWYLRVILATKGEPEMCLSANLTVMLYSPGAVGRYVTVQVPSPLSLHLISVLEGPSMASDNPPERKENIRKIKVTTRHWARTVKQGHWL